MLNADPSKVSTRAKKRGLPQVYNTHFLLEINVRIIYNYISL